MEMHTIGSVKANTRVNILPQNLHSDSKIYLDLNK